MGKNTLAGSRFRGRADQVQANKDRQWYRIVNNTDSTDVHIYDEIGYWGTTASDFVAQLSALDTPQINVHINSPGGEIFDGLAIYNVLRAHSARKVGYVDSLAASIASVIAMACDELVMRPFSQLMIHDGSGLCIGNAADMEEMMNLLNAQSDNIASVYADRAGGSARDWRAAMKAETWYTAEEAVAAKLADRVGAPERQSGTPAPSNSWDLTIFRYAGREQAPAPTAVIRRAEPAIPPAPTPVPTPEPVKTPEPWGLADAFRRGFDPEPSNPIDEADFAIDPTEFYNAIREGMISQ